MAKHRIPAGLLDSMQNYAASPENTEVDDSLLLLPILQEHFTKMEQLEAETLAKIDAVELQDAMIKSALSCIDRE